MPAGAAGCMPGAAVRPAPFFSRLPANAKCATPPSPPARRARSSAPPRGLGHLADRPTRLRPRDGMPWRRADARRLFLCPAAAYLARRRVVSVARRRVGYATARNARDSRPACERSCPAGRLRRPVLAHFPPDLPRPARMDSADPCPAARLSRPLHNALADPRMRRDAPPGMRAWPAARAAPAALPPPSCTHPLCPAPSPRERTAAPQARAALLLSPCTAPPARRGPAAPPAPARRGPPVPRCGGAGSRPRRRSLGGPRRAAGPRRTGRREPPRRALRRGPIGLGRQSQCLYSQQIPPLA